MDIEEKLSKFRQETVKRNPRTEESGPIRSFSLIERSDNAPSTKSTDYKEDYKKKRASRAQNLYNRLVRRPVVEENVVEQDEDQLDEDMESFNVRAAKRALKFLLWCILYAIFIRLEFGIVYVVVSSFVIIYFNTSTGKKKKNTVSAYSVFNPNVERLPGQLTAEQLEKSMVRGF